MAPQYGKKLSHSLVRPGCPIEAGVEEMVGLVGDAPFLVLLQAFPEGNFSAALPRHSARMLLGAWWLAAR